MRWRSNCYSFDIFSVRRWNYRGPTAFIDRIVSQKLKHVQRIHRKLYISIYNLQWYWKLNKQKDIIRQRRCNMRKKNIDFYEYWMVNMREWCRNAIQKNTVYSTRFERKKNYHFASQSQKFDFLFLEVYIWFWVCKPPHNFESRFFPSVRSVRTYTCITLNRVVFLQIWHIIIALGSYKFAALLLLFRYIFFFVSCHCMLLFTQTQWISMFCVWQSNVKMLPKWHTLCIIAHKTRRKKKRTEKHICVFSQKQHAFLFAVHNQSVIESPCSNQKKNEPNHHAKKMCSNDLRIRTYD